MKLLTMAISVAAAGVTTHAAEYIISSGPLNLAIPDANPVGIANTLQGLSGEVGYITNVEVTLNISGGYNGDLYAYLSHSTGFSVLLNRTGRTAGNPFGYADAGFSVTFSDAALTDIHVYGGNGGAPVSGTFQPDARNFDPASVVDTTGRSAYLDAFHNLDPNGTWTLFLADMSGGDQSTLTGWQVNISTVVPEPGPIAVGVLGLGLLLAGRYVRARKY